MPIEVFCTQCGNQLRAPDQLAGKNARCPKCRAVIEVPQVVVDVEIVQDPQTNELGPPGVFAPTQGSSGQHFRWEPQPPTVELGEDVAMRLLLPVGRSLWAIAAGYAGIFALFCGVPGPIAIVFGWMAIREIRRNPKKHGMGRAIFGLVAGIVGTFTVVIVLVVLWLRE